jgi:hypothetical protein
LTGLSIAALRNYSELINRFLKTFQQRFGQDGCGLRSVFQSKAGQKQLSEDSMKHCKFNTTSAALLLIVFTPLVSQAQTPSLRTPR